MLDYKPQREGEQKSLETQYLDSTGTTGTFTAHWSKLVKPRKSTLALKSNFFLIFQTGVHDNNYFLYRDFSKLSKLLLFFKVSCSKQMSFNLSFYFALTL